MSTVVNPDADVLPRLRLLGDRVLIEVLEEYEPLSARTGLVVVEDEDRSQQGVILDVGPEVPPDVRPGLRVLFDDDHCPYWRGPNPMSYLSVLLGEGREYVVVPAGQILSIVEGADGGDQGQQSPDPDPRAAGGEADA